jgi:hypothetical protein
VLDQLPGKELLVHPQLALHHLLVEDVDQDVTGDVGRVGRARLAGSPERTLGDPAVLGAREDGAPVLELVDVARRLLAEDLDRVLVAEVVRALDRVEGVLLRVVLGGVPERGVDAALGRPGVATHRVDLRQERDVGARVVRLDRGAHARETSPEHQHVVARRRATDHCGRSQTAATCLLAILRSVREKISVTGVPVVAFTRLMIFED